MTPDEFDAISILLDKGFKWREPFGEVQASAYRMLLSDYDADQVMTAIRVLVARGQVFGPTPGELVAVIRQDPDRPTFEEAYKGLYGPGGVFGIKRSSVTVSPWVTAFADYAGKDWIRLLPVEDPDTGKWARRELEQAYDRFLLATENRAVAELAGGRRRQLGRFDPLAALEAGGTV